MSGTDQVSGPNRLPRAKIVETLLGDIPWIVARGERRAVFEALGRHAAGRIAAVLNALPDAARLRDRAAASPRVATHLAQVLDASRSRHPDAWEELASLAAGAGVDADELALLSARGDALDVEDADAEECSDLAWSDGEQAVLGHNEDGDRVLDGRCALLTLLVDGDPAVVTWWYPGFLPGNTFSINQHGLVFGVDAIGIPNPPPLPARPFIARSLQRAAGLDEAIDYLDHHRSAGGFAYVLGQLKRPRLVAVEHGAGLSQAHEERGPTVKLWHTNHLRYLPAPLGRASANSMQRGEILEAEPLTGPVAVEPVKRVLTTRHPAGVRATGESRTLCTFITDLSAGQLTLASSKGREQTLEIDLLLNPPSPLPAGPKRGDV